MKRVAVIVAGGKGVRMGGDLPKQYLCVGCRPILMHTLEAFHRFDSNLSLILVIPDSHRALWAQLCEEHHFALPHRIASGGATRFESVKNGLSLVDCHSVVAIHDGVRPFVSSALLQRCFEAALQHRAALPAVAVVDTLRQIERDGNSITVDRNQYRLVQTPQVFRSDLLKEAYRQPANGAFTDDASVVEAAGIAVSLVEGERENIKITTPFDLELAECLWSRWKF